MEKLLIVNADVKSNQVVIRANGPMSYQEIMRLYCSSCPLIGVACQGLANGQAILKTIVQMEIKDNDRAFKAIRFVTMAADDNRFRMYEGELESSQPIYKGESNCATSYRLGLKQSVI